MPARSYGNIFDPELGPAIQMEPEDHRKTASHSASGRSYAPQIELLANGKNYAAFLLDVVDIGKVETEIMQFGKYAAAVAQATLYMNCLKANGLVQ